MRLFLLAFPLLANLIHLPASAADAAAVAAIAQYEGADYLQRLITGAKKEGKLMVYTSATLEDSAAINTAFEKKYGVKVQVWRAGADKVLQRVVTEAQGGRFDVDVLEVGTPQLEAMSREKILAAVKSPHHADLLDGAVPTHREWVGARLNVFVHAYNTKLVKKEDLPKTYEDLLNPKWKGKLGIEATDDDWFANVVRGLGEEAGVKLFRDIVATNGMSVRKGHTLLTNMVASGEVPFALTSYNFTAEQIKQKGAPIDWYAMPPAIARANGLGVARRAAHPYVALLFYDFMISEEGQQILAKRDFVPTNKKIPSPLGAMPMKLVDAALVLDEEQKWIHLYDEIIVKQGK